jgi:hypothetical protein
MPKSHGCWEPTHLNQAIFGIEQFLRSAHLNPEMKCVVALLACALPVAIPAHSFEPNGDLIVELKNAKNGQVFAAIHGLKYQRTFASDPRKLVLSAGPFGVSASLNRLKRDRQVKNAWADANWTRTPCQFVPNDPYHSPIETQPSSPSDNSYYLGQNSPVYDAWQQNFTGSRKGIGTYQMQIAFLDSGFESAHPDLRFSGNGYDF